MKALVIAALALLLVPTVGREDGVPSILYGVETADLTPALAKKLGVTLTQ